MKICNFFYADIIENKLEISNIDFANSYKLVDDEEKTVGYIILQNISLKTETNGYVQYDNKVYWEELYKKPSKKIGYIKINKEEINTGDFHNLFDKLINSIDDKETLLWIDIKKTLYLYYTEILQGFGKIQNTDTFGHIRVFDVYHRFFQ